MPSANDSAQKAFLSVTAKTFDNNTHWKMSKIKNSLWKIVAILKKNKTLQYAERIRHTPTITQRMEFLKEVPGCFFIRPLIIAEITFWQKHKNSKSIRILIRECFSLSLKYVHIVSYQWRKKYRFEQRTGDYFFVRIGFYT